jgi:hypothetical protein
MITIQPVEVPVDRTIDVTVTLKFPESQLKEWAEHSELCAELKKAFADELEIGDGVYDSVRGL